jgi:hypothetical protein
VRGGSAPASQTLEDIAKTGNIQAFFQMRNEQERRARR